MTRLMFSSFVKRFTFTEMRLERVSKQSKCNKTNESLKHLGVTVSLRFLPHSSVRKQ